MSAHVSESSGTGDAVDAPSATSNGRRSKVWEHYEQDLVIVDDVPKAVCKYCALKLTATRRAGTSSLLNHIGESCRSIEAEVRVKFLQSLKKKSSDDGFIFDPKKSRKLMTKFCIHAEVAFRKFEDPYFEEWMDSMQPTFRVIGRQTIRNDCVLTYDEMRDQLKLELQALESRICLTSDMWTSVQKLGYMCVTAHYIDANFVLKKKIISFKDVKYPHTKEAIEEALCRCLADWGIKRKLFTITLDNATNNKSKRRANTQPRSEIDAYLEENFTPSSVGTYDILTWWKTNAEKYPVLSAMARDFLAVPLSTVSSESAFSCSGRILGDTRASLTPHALEALVCGKDWLTKVPDKEGPSMGVPSLQVQDHASDGQV